MSFENHTRTLDMLFDSNHRTVGPDAMKTMMKKYLDRDQDIVGGANYIIKEWKEIRLKYEEDEISIKALELL
tara:strand:- start:552 stop:767 length:216 start_codon:yes stop_codon:yes gene_type:complete